MRIWFRLSLAMGIPVGELQQRMTSWEFSHWVALYQMDPWGEERADLRNAMVCATLANIHRGKGSKRVTIGDYMPRFGEDVKESTETMLAKARHMMRSAGVRFIDAKTGKPCRPGSDN